MKTLTPSKLAQVPIDELIPHPNNPRRGNLEVIKASIQKNGFYGAVVAQKSSRRILVGNHRWQAAKELKHKTVPVIWVDVDDATALRILLVDNRANDLADDNTHDLALMLERLGADALDGTGYTREDFADILKQSLPAVSATSGVVDTPIVCRIGPEYRFTIERHVYDSWLHDIRQSAGFDEPAISKEILKRLGFA